MRIAGAPSLPPQDQAGQPRAELLPGVRQAVRGPQGLRLQRGAGTGEGGGTSIQLLSLLTWLTRFVYSIAGGGYFQQFFFKFS